MGSIQLWEAWFPDAGATGLLVARSRIATVDAVWLHSAPPRLSVVVRDAGGWVIAQAEDLERSGESVPMTLLSIDGDSVTREDRWPTHTDIGDVVLLAGGEAGILKAWWNAADGSEWRWTVEFQNRR
jgi:hypothetical protein